MNKFIIPIIIVVAVAAVSLYYFTKSSKTCVAGYCPAGSEVTPIATTTVQKVSAAKFKALIEAEDTPQIIDIRTPSEFNYEGHITSAKNIDYYSESFRANMEQLDKSKTTYVYCRSGSRSGTAVALMKTMGFTTIIELENGIQTWSLAKYPLVKTLADY